MRGIASIAGIGQTDFSKSSGRSELQLAAEASLEALADAGLTVDDVDGMVTFTIDPTEDNELMRTLGVSQLCYTARLPHGGAASAATVFAAASAVAAGVATHVLVYRALNARSGNRFGRAAQSGFVAYEGDRMGLCELAGAVRGAEPGRDPVAADAALDAHAWPVEPGLCRLHRGDP